MIPTTLELPFSDGLLQPRCTEFGAGAWLLRGFSLPSDEVVRDLFAVASEAPFRHMFTPGGRKMSVAMSNCGKVGWVTDARGYRYDRLDPSTGRSWPLMPASLRSLAVRAAIAAGYAGFEPDACLINRYEPGARLSLHQDKDERDFDQPIVSVSLGLPALFLWGGASRSAPVHKMPLMHGDVVVFGGASRLTYHGVQELDAGVHPQLGAHRINLTFRAAL